MSAATALSAPGQSIFDVVRAAISMENYLGSAGAKRQGRRWQCLIHDDANPSATIHKERFHCWSCDWMGDVIDLEQKLNGGSARESTLRLAERFGVVLPHARPLNPREKEQLSAARARADLAVRFRSAIREPIVQLYVELSDIRLKLIDLMERSMARGIQLDEFEELDNELDERMTVANNAVETVSNASIISVLSLLYQKGPA